MSNDYDTKNSQKGYDSNNFKIKSLMFINHKNNMIGGGGELKIFLVMVVFKAGMYTESHVTFTTLKCTNCHSAFWSSCVFAQKKLFPLHFVRYLGWSWEVARCEMQEGVAQQNEVHKSL